MRAALALSIAGMPKANRKKPSAFAKGSHQSGVKSGKQNALVAGRTTSLDPSEYKSAPSTDLPLVSNATKPINSRAPLLAKAARDQPRLAQHLAAKSRAGLR